MNRRRTLLAAAAVVAVVGRTAVAQPILLPVHVAGSVEPSDVDALVEGFCRAIGGEGAPPVLVSGAPCPHPETCVQQGLTAPQPHASYWLQLSGAGDELLAVALRLDALGAVRARATGHGHPGQAAALAATLAAAVADGQGTGLDVDTDGAKAEVALDGEAVGSSPVELGPLDAGDHWVRVTSKGNTVVGLVPAYRGQASRMELSFKGIPRRMGMAAGPRRARPGAWPLLPILAGGAVAAVLVATDPAGLMGPDHVITVVPAG